MIFITALSLTFVIANSTASELDLILHNGKVYTGKLNDNKTNKGIFASAIAVSNGKIQYVGTDSGIQKWIKPSTQIIDLKGRLVLPGFIDNHNHLGEGGETNCILGYLVTLRDEEETLKKCAKDIPPGKWVIGYGADLYKVLTDNGIDSNPRRYLDLLFPQHPVIIMEYTSHAMFVNSKALELAGLTYHSPNPTGGIIMRSKKDKTLLGILIDNAGDIVMEMAVNSIENKMQLLKDGIEYGLEMAREVGITSVGDGRSYIKRHMIEAWRQVEKENGLTLRIFLRPWIYPHYPMDQQLKSLSIIYQPDVSQNIIINQAKLYVDGAPDTYTARVIKPYIYPMFKNKGINYFTKQRLTRWLDRLNTIGYGAHIHALGDLGVREALDAIQNVRRKKSIRSYHITHLAMVDKKDIKRFKQLGVVADIQIEGAKSRSKIIKEYEPLIGKHRARQVRYRPVKELHSTGATITLSSDWSVYPMSPFYAISYSLQEKSWSIYDAIDAYTLNPAKALGIDHLTGTITVGKSADLIVTNNIFELDAKDIRDQAVDITIFNGKIVYKK